MANSTYVMGTLCIALSPWWRPHLNATLVTKDPFPSSSWRGSNGKHHPYHNVPMGDPTSSPHPLPKTPLSRPPAPEATETHGALHLTPSASHTETLSMPPLTFGPCGGGHPEVPSPKATQTPALTASPHLPRQPLCPPGPVPTATEGSLGGTSALGASRLRPPASAVRPSPTPPPCTLLPGMGGHPLTCHPPPAPTAPFAVGSGPHSPSPQETPCCISSTAWVPQMGPPVTRSGCGWPTLGANGPCQVLVTHTGCW